MQELVARSAPSAGQPGPVRFGRRIDGLPLFDGVVVVGVNAANAVILVNVADVPPRVTGRARISRDAAIEAAKAAMPGLEIADTPRAERGWKAAGEAVRPVWRVDFAAARPPGYWRPTWTPRAERSCCAWTSGPSARGRASLRKAASFRLPGRRVERRDRRTARGGAL